jgi:heme exporter protein D
MLGLPPFWRSTVGRQALSEFVAMGGYAAYVWPAFGFALVALLALLAQSWHAAHRREAELVQLRSLLRAGRSTRSGPVSPGKA